MKEILVRIGETTPRKPIEAPLHSKLRYTTSEALFKAKANGVVTLKEMLENQQNQKIYEYTGVVDFWNTQNRNYRLKLINTNLKQFLINNWNIKNQSNPAVFFKNLKPIRKDGGIAYAYTGEQQ